MNATTKPLSYSAAASQGTPEGPSNAPQPYRQNVAVSSSAQATDAPIDWKRARSPSHIPQTITSPENEETVYVLTLLTDKPHHTRMTALRNKYFPPRLNKLAAHLTLFHALPGSKLSSEILPRLQHIANLTSTFPILADRPFRLKRGIAISIPAGKGGANARELHRALQEPWKDQGFLSEQDATPGVQLHYTLMNKVDDETAVVKAFQEIEQSWQGDNGKVVGFGLWRYDRGFWRWERKFEFHENLH